MSVVSLFLVLVDASKTPQAFIYTFNALQDLRHVHAMAMESFACPCPCHPRWGMARIYNPVWLMDEVQPPTLAGPGPSSKSTFWPQNKRFSSWDKKNVQGDMKHGHKIFPIDVSNGAFQWDRNKDQKGRCWPMPVRLKESKPNPGVFGPEKSGPWKTIGPVLDSPDMSWLCKCKIKICQKR